MIIDIDIRRMKVQVDQNEGVKALSTTREAQ